MSWLSKLLTAQPASVRVATAPLRGDDLRAARLQPTKFREGYDMAQVDALLERAAVALDEHARGAAPSLTADEILASKFAATKFREGYDQDETDDLLDRVVQSLRA